MRCVIEMNLPNGTNTELSWVALAGCTMAWAGKVSDCYPEIARSGQGCGLVDLYHLSGPLHLSAWAGIQTLSSALQFSGWPSELPHQLLISCPMSDSPLLIKGQRCSLCILSPDPGSKWSLLNTWEVSNKHYCTKQLYLLAHMQASVWNLGGGILVLTGLICLFSDWEQSTWNPRLFVLIE